MLLGRLVPPESAVYTPMDRRGLPCSGLWQTHEGCGQTASAIQ